jgi:EmrB/QacA subfamily drug resistance transporter
MATTATAAPSPPRSGTEAPTAISPSGVRLVFATVLIAMLLSALDQTIVSTALPTIVGDLGGGHLSWVVSSYLLADTITTVLAGKLGDLFGRKLILQISAALFMIASATCGFANGMTWLIAWRFVQGLGAGGLGVTASAVLADVVPLRDRAKYQSALGAMFGVALVLGPLLGGLFTDHLSWRWVFFVNLPLGLLVMGLAAYAVPTVSRAQQRPRVDFAGIGFVSIGAGALTLALSWGGSDYGWGSAMIIGLFVCSAVAFVIFGAVEARAAEPMLPLRLFRNPVFAVTSALAFIVGFAMLGSLTFLPTYSQYVKGVSATASGVRTLPLVVGLLGASIFAGWYVSRTGRYKVFPIAGSAVMALGLYLFSRLTLHSGYLFFAVGLFVFGIGIGLCMQLLTIIVQNSTDYRDLGVATSGVSFFRTLGSSFGAAIFGTIFTTTLAPKLRSAFLHVNGVNPETINDPKALHKYPAHQIQPIVDAYAHALHVLFLWAVPIAAFGVLLALFIKQAPLRSTAQAGATDPGAGFSVPESDDRQAQLEAAIARVFRQAGPGAGAEIAARAGSGLTMASAWCIGTVAAREYLGQPTDLRTIAKPHRLPGAVLWRAFEQTRELGLLAGDMDGLHVTEAGHAELDRLASAARDWITAQLADWNVDNDPAFTAALRRSARRLIALDAPTRPEPDGADARLPMAIS